MRHISPSLIAMFFLLGSLSQPALSQVSFFQPPTYAGTGNLFTADFNRDGKPDLLSSDGTMQLGNGDGTFTTGTAVSGTPLAVTDFNGDGIPDVLEQGTGTLLVLLGKGDGTFQAPVSTNSGASLSKIVAGDLNGDGKSDVVGIFNGSVIVYLSNGDGTFSPGVTYNLSLAGTSTIPSLLLDDFNSDGKLDVVVVVSADNVAGEEIVLLGNGNGTLQSPTSSTGIVDPSYAVAGDFNGDGKLDLAISADIFCNGACSIPATVYMLRGNGDGTFQPPSPVLAGNGPLLSADVNGDGKLDLIFEDDPTSVQVYLGNGDGTFSNASNYYVNFQLSPALTGIVTADFNLDGKSDIALGGAVLLGNGNGTFQGVPLGVVPSKPVTAVINDFDKNGTLDVALLSNGQDKISNQNFYNVYILKNNGTGALSLVHTYALQEPGYGIASADFNGDGNPDIIVFQTDPVTLEWGYSVLLGNGNGSFQTPQFYPQTQMTGANSYSIIASDFNGDHKTDIAVSLGSSLQSFALLLGKGDGTFASPVDVFDGGALTLLVGDFNGDGKLDIAAGGANSNNEATAILLGNGDGTFQPATFPPNLVNFAAQFTADLNSDSKPDLLSVNQVALGNGDGSFTVLQAINYPIIGVSDLNGDGKPDAVVINGVGSTHPLPTGVLLGNGDGTFGPIINVLSSFDILPSPLLFADMNGDGALDIVFPLDGAIDGMAVLLNNTSPGFELSTTTVSPGTIAAGNSATSIITVTPILGFNAATTLSCGALPSGTSCNFNPPLVVNSSGTAQLTITTTSNTPAGNFSIKIQGKAGSIVSSAALSLVIQLASPPASDFTIGVAPAGAMSETVNSGQTAQFPLLLTPSGTFNGTVNLSCAIAPIVTPAPLCGLSVSSVQISGNGSQSFTATVTTTAPMTAGAVSHIPYRQCTIPLICSIAFLGSGLLFFGKRRQVSALIVLMIVSAFIPWTGCGGGSPSPSSSPSSPSSGSSSPGTPAGTYTATVTATSGNLSHNMTLTVIVK